MATPITFKSVSGVTAPDFSSATQAFRNAFKDLQGAAQSVQAGIANRAARQEVKALEDFTTNINQETDVNRLKELQSTLTNEDLRSQNINPTEAFNLIKSRIPLAKQENINLFKESLAKDLSVIDDPSLGGANLFNKESNIKQYVEEFGNKNNLTQIERKNLLSEVSTAHGITPENKLRADLQRLTDPVSGEVDLKRFIKSSLNDPDIDINKLSGFISGVKNITGQKAKEDLQKEIAKEERQIQQFKRKEEIKLNNDIDKAKRLQEVKASAPPTKDELLDFVERAVVPDSWYNFFGQEELEKARGLVLDALQRGEDPGMIQNAIAAGADGTDISVGDFNYYFIQEKRKILQQKQQEYLNKLEQFKQNG